MKNGLFCGTAAVALAMACMGMASNAQAKDGAVLSFDTGYTITKVRTATGAQGDYIIASTYEGMVIAADFDGNFLWANPLSGYMNQDIWAGDITGDGVDEVFAANADGSVYAVSSKGDDLWSFKPNDVPMNAVTTVSDGEKTYVVAGGYDTSIYYLDPKGTLLKTLPSTSYSIDKARSGQKKGKRTPEDGVHIASFIRPVAKADGTEMLIVHSQVNSMQASGSIYTFAPLADSPTVAVGLKGRVPGDMKVGDVDGDGDDELIFGSSGVARKSDLTIVDPITGKQLKTPLQRIAKERGLAYRVQQTGVIGQGDNRKLLSLLGTKILLLDPAKPDGKAEVIEGKFSYNDIWHHQKSGKVILGSTQSGGSAITIIDTTNASWKEEFKTLVPPGKLVELFTNVEDVKAKVRAYKPAKNFKPERAAFFLTERKRGVASLMERLETNYGSPVFLNGATLNNVENWDRSGMANARYRDQRDGRKKYTATQGEILTILEKSYEGAEGIAMWGGHGNDPYMFSNDTKRKLVDYGISQNKHTVLIYPEIEDPSFDFDFVLSDMLYPLADYGKDKKLKIHLRNKHMFWNSEIYEDRWAPVLNGDYASVIVPSMEETTDKSMEVSLASRIGLWAAGSFDEWGARAARDNTSFDRMRQHSNQMVPNHMLRQMVYAISSGATQVNNFSVEQNYMSVLWELIGKGVLHVPTRDQLVSINPVYLSMTHPDPEFQDDANNVKWLSFYNEAAESKPKVFSRLNGTWPGAATTEWDFSRYAAGATERRLNFIPKYPNGMVMIAPPQKGADKLARGLMREKLHPIYKDILTEVTTDGRDYISADGTERFAADEYYKVVEQKIKEGAAKLPLTVTGDVGWIVSQTSPTNLRLTVIDSGYINPNARTARVKLQTISPTAMTDVLTGEEIAISEDGYAEISVPTGLFRFIDITLSKPLS